MKHETIQISRYLDPKSFLQDIFDAMKQDEEGMTFERFSELLGFGKNSYSHQIISGRRQITPKASVKICEALSLKGAAKKYFQTLCVYFYSKEQAPKDEALKEILILRIQFEESDLDRAQIQYFSEWYHAAIRELIALPDFTSDPDWIATRMHPQITPDEAAASFSLLQRIGYIQFDAYAKKWVQTDKVVKSPADVQNLMIARFHHNMIDLAKESLHNTRSDRRDVGSLTLPLSEVQFSELRSQLRKYRQELAAVHAQAIPESGSEIYQFNLQLFPLTRRSL